MKLYYLPLEPIEKRYTAQWYNWFKEVFEKEGVDFEYISGEKILSNLQSTMFLDMKNTFVWKFQQLKDLFKKDLSDEDWIFIPDGEFPGIEAIEYFRKFYNSKVKIATIWHAGTYDQWDLTYQKGLERIGTKLEEVWFDISDVVFVATKFHKDIIVSNRNVEKDKIKITGLPINVSQLIQIRDKVIEKEKVISFTGRKTIEKGYDIVQELQKKYPVQTTLDLNLDKEGYYKFLARSAGTLAPSRQETFGYGIVESMGLGTEPIVPDKLSFKDYVPKKFRYNSKEEMEEMIVKRLENTESNKKIVKYIEKYHYEKVISKMLKVLDLC